MKSNLCDYNDAYSLVIGDITVAAAPTTQVVLKNCATFTKCTTKIEGTTIDDAENLDLVMPTYNVLEYSSNYSDINNIANTGSFKNFKYKAKLLGNTEAQPNPSYANGILKNATITVPLKYLGNFWRSREIPLINCKVELKINWNKYCILSAAGNDSLNNNDKDSNGNNIIFTIKDTKLYVPVVTLSQETTKSYQNFLAKDSKD